MKKNLSRKVTIPAGMTATFVNDTLTISKDGKKISKKFVLHKVSLKIENNEIVVFCDGSTRRESAIIGSVEAHVKNMINGFSNEYVYELEVCNIHFPMTIKKEGNQLVVKSFLGETKDRYALILPDVNVEIKGSKITVSSINRDAAGQTAANIEKSTRLTNRDRRIFQDGIFLTDKCGRKI